MKYARIVESVVQECVETNPYLLFQPEYAAQFIEVSDEVHSGWSAVGDGTFTPPVEPEPDPREVFKTQRAAAVERIRVTTAAGHEFDGDETSQTRMARAITGLQFAAPGTTIPWVLADNTVIQVGVSELAEALVLAGQEQAALWVPA